MKVLVCGATGTTGAAVARALSEAGQSVRALTRRPESAEALAAHGYEGAVGDLTDRGSLDRALEGVDAVYVAQPASPEQAADEARLAEAAKAAGVSHLVKLSVIGAGPDAPITFARIHHEAEQAIEASGIAWTFLQPNGFMQNDLQWAGQIAGGTIHAPVADAAWSIIDVADIADVAVKALSAPDVYNGRRLVLTGPEALTSRQRVEILAQVLGQRLAVVDVPVPAAREAMIASGMPAWYADRLAELFDLYATGAAAGISPEVETVLGRPAGTYAAFVEAHREALAG